MELVSIGLWGIKRFEADKGDMDVFASPIAIVGPNEAGKTTFLRAFERLNDDEPIPFQELTRGGKGEACIRAKFRLNDDDRAAIAEAGGVGRPVTFTVYKRESRGGLFTKLEPPLTRDLEAREKARKTLERVRSGRWAKEELEEGVSRRSDTLRAIADLLEGEDAFAEDDLEQLRSHISALEDEDGPLPSRVAALARKLIELADLEALPDPDEAAREILLLRRPRFLWFDDAWRSIESQFNVQADPSPALRALLGLVGLDLGGLRQAIADADEATIAELIEDANREFDVFFKDRWKQANIRVYLSINGELLNVFVRNARRGRLIPIAERSEGLRQFLALLAFVEQEAANQDVVLLVDEADAHLHYDGQADLVHMFSTQTVVEKILYTTHSAGCLPTDLGTGIRVIEPIGPADQEPQDWERSRINNAFWTAGEGFSPLLLAMGAGSFAFSSVRRAVIGEGISEVILLPTLFREATGRDRIEFQVAPGSANVSPSGVGDLSLTAAKVCFLVDGDEGGLAHREKLIEAGVPDDRILVLGGIGANLAVEDILQKDAYVTAVNAVLARHGLEMDAADVPDLGRKKAVTDWCAARGQDKPSEREVSQHLVEGVREAQREGQPGSLLDPAYEQLVVDLHAAIEELLR